MSKHLDTVLGLGLLDDFSVGAHAVLGEGLGEGVGDEGGLVQAGEGDKLPAVAELGEAVDVGFLLFAGHGGLPVEGGGEVVCEPERGC